MSDIIRRLILKGHPDYDFDRYSFSFGDVVRTNSGALVFVIYSAIEYVEAFVIKSGFGLKKHQKTQIKYKELPYYKKDEFISEELVVNKKIKWSVGDVVIDPRYGTKLLLTEAVGNDGFYALVLESDNEYYKETSVYMTNTYREYID